VALLTDACLDEMGKAATTILDGSFVADPLYGAVVAALDPRRRVRVSTDGTGTAAGAALLAGHGTRDGPVEVATETPQPLELPGLDKARKLWRDLARTEQAAAAGMGRQQ
jgi:hypothetical protein